METNPDVKVLEKCRVVPPPDAVTELTLPLMFYDLQWLLLPPCQHLHFYRFIHPKPTSNFIITSLKSSLSLVLKHFLALAGKLICPIDSDGMPELRYMKGDFLSLTFAESSECFDYLVGEHQKEAYKFSKLLPQLPDPIVISGSEVSPVFALQVTVFPNSGISIGRTFLHVVGDAATFDNFNESWASVDKFNGDSLELLASSCFKPSYDKSIIQDPFQLGQRIFNDIKLLKYQHSHGIPNPIACEDQVHATFILHSSDIMKLKSTHNASTFTLSCAIIWSCLSKSLDAVSEKKMEDDNQDYLLAYINCRQRFDLLIPQNYFGNCIVPCMVKSIHKELTGHKGLLVAAAAIRDAIHKRLHDKEGILRGDWMPDSYTLTTTTVAPETLEIEGSMQHNVYSNNANFDWGIMEKMECVCISSSTIVVLITKSRRFEGGCELSISLPKKRMDAFTTIFKSSINALHTRCP